jgi:hypothetical protein
MTKSHLNIFHSFQSEWLKTKRSLALWLALGGAGLIPLIFLISRLIYFNELYPASQAKHLWESLFFQCWNITNAMLLPLGVILATSLVAQIEYRNNTWKQLLATPQSLTVIYFIKLGVIIAMLLQFFMLFNLGVYLCGILPSLVYRGIPFPKEAVPALFFLKMNLKFFIDCLPIVALQYLVSIRFKNFMLPLGIGIGLYVSSVIAVSWKYGYLVPYTYSLLNTMARQSPISPNVHLHAWAIGYFVLFTLFGYLLFMTKREKG